MENQNNLESIRHSLAHILAAAVLKKHPKAKFGIGPVIESGFYYDFILPENISSEDLTGIEKDMRGIIHRKLPFVGEKVTAAAAKKLFKDQPFKLELIKEFSKEEKQLTVYSTGNVFMDLCKGGHAGNTSEINPDAFKLTHTAGAYWKGDEKNPQMQRIYGVAFATKEELDRHLAMLEEAKKRDHKKLGKELDLFVFSETVGKGLPLWTPRGSTIRREIERFIVDEEIRRGYLHVYTPDIANLALYKKSGHYPYYKDSMYSPITIEDEQYMLRPMSCPHHFELYLSRPHTYKELPIRFAEIVKLYRFEQSGELAGLVRVRSFSLADAHIFCMRSQAEEEINGVLDLIEFVAKTFGLEFGKDYRYRLSLGDRKDSKKYFKDDKSWDEAESTLRKVLVNRKANFFEAEQEAAFYGPKIDVQMKNVNGKEDTAFTVQYDFVMPKSFNLTYKNNEGKDEQPIVVHRSSVGAIERIIGFLIEHYAGAFPLWLSPVQAAIIPISENQNEYANSLKHAFLAEGIRTEVYDSNETLGKKIRESETQKNPYTVIVGEKEQNAKTVSVRGRGNKNMGEMEIAQFVLKLRNEIDKRI